MGSRARHSSGRKAALRHARKGKSLSTRRKPFRSTPDFDAILGRLSDSLSIIAAATHALTHAQQGSDGTVTPADVGEEITTLEHGVNALRGAYNEIDVAIREVRT
jgi:hypothetical protein